MLGIRVIAAAAAGILLTAGAAHAQDAYYGEAPQYVLDLGIGGLAKPKYPGADDYILVPYPIAQVSRFYLPVVGQQSKSTRNGLFIGPSFGINGERKPSDDKSLKGTKKVPTSFELGLRGGVRSGPFTVYASARQGFDGHTGQVGDVGINVTMPITPNLSLTAGPRAGWGSQDYMRTYFGVTGKEAARGPLKKYRPDGGFQSVGLVATATLALSDRTSLHARGSWDRLIGDAGDSPIVKAGDKNQWTAGLGISRRFDFNLFR
ncbi:MipA/OmpV family protein [Bauldia sp.]|uniref:MipA/OmpV family protein n=1 Tax=Bauldia sp. TaxID=2575872 RepID=UPI003BA845D6